MSVKMVQALMSGLVVLACIIAGVILLLNGIDTLVGIGMLVIAGGYLGIDLTPWIPLGKNQKHKAE